MKKLCLIFFLAPLTVLGQRGIDGPGTISATTIVNEYTALTSDVSAGATTLSVSNSGLNANNRFGAGNTLAQGDLIMIYQPQGAMIDATPDIWGAFSAPNDATWGSVVNYNNSGNYEYAEVESVAAGSITITCGLRNSYSIAGHAQVIRIPRYTTLTINSGGVLSGDTWNGTVGGVIAVEVDGATTINSGGSINASGLGFRGGQCLDNNTVIGGGYFASNGDNEGGEKGESIAGYTTEYTALIARYCMGAPANGGGGSTSHNGGGGGGANGGTGIWTGNGNPDPNAAYVNAWNQESAGFATSSSSGGGRGGYTFSNSNQNAATTPPGSGSWGGDNRRAKGGLGGRPLDYSTGKIFFGGGGGSGEQNDGYAGSGGRGGGIIYIMSYGNITGNGQVISNGNNGTSSLTSPTPGSGYSGKDGAGGAGGGGAIIINTTGTASGFTCSANGGQGGNQFFVYGPFYFGTNNDAYGPGGGGGGGYIAISNGSPTATTNGGNNGTTNGGALSEFPPNGATRGGSGTNNGTINDYSFTLTNATVCSGGTTTLTATINGTVPGGTTLTWYDSQFGGNVVGTGNSFTTPVLGSTTTYYVGFCPGWYTLPVTVTVGSSPVIDDSNISISDETCAGNDGSISGINVSGGSGTLTYEWNGNASVNADLSNASAGSYTLVVTDQSGCSSSAGPYTIGSGGGPVIDVASMVLTSTSCGNDNGSIIGITASGGSGSLTYEWNGNVVGSPDISSLTSGSYTLVVTDQLGCSSSAGPFTINPSSNPVIDTTNMVVADETCGNANGSITGITTSGGSGSNVITWNGTVNGSEDIFSLAGGTYEIIITDGSGCDDTISNIIVNSLGSPVIDDSGIIITDATCGNNNGSITGITVSGGTGTLIFDWNGTTGTGADTTAIGGGSFTLTVTDQNGCTVSSGPYTVNSTTNPTVSISGTDVSCFGLSDGSAVATASGGDGNYTYQWTGGPASDTYPSLPAGTYTVLVTDGNGCQIGDVVVISEPTEIIGTISGNSLLCQGDVTTLTASGSTQYSWNNGATTAAITVSPMADTTYVVIVSDGTCNDTVSVNVVVNDLPVAGVSGNTTICVGESALLTATGGMTYQWNTSDTSSSITVSPITNATYTVVVSNNCGTDSTTISVVVNPGPIADAGADQTINLGSSTTLNGSGGTSYVWTPSTGLSCTNCQNPTATPASDMEYIVFVTDANGCTDTDTVKIFVEENNVLFIPDAFSPNGDGSNEILFVRAEGLENFIFRLYDRWGQLVFETDDVTIGWDGIFKGEPLNEGVFVYIFEGNYIGQDPFEQKGNITLHR